MVILVPYSHSFTWLIHTTIGWPSVFVLFTPTSLCTSPELRLLSQHRLATWESMCEAPYIILHLLQDSSDDYHYESGVLTGSISRTFGSRRGFIARAASRRR